MVILLFVDDFCLIASSIVQLLTMMLTAQSCFENNSSKSKAMVFHETPAASQARGPTQWTIRRTFPSLAAPLSILEVTRFVYIDVAVANDPALSYDHQCTKVLLSMDDRIGYKQPHVRSLGHARLAHSLGYDHVSAVGF